MDELLLSSYYSGVSSAIRSLKELQRIYDPIMAFNFSPFNFWKTGETKISKILGYFMNPNETHGQGRLFLDIFLTYINLPENILTGQLLTQVKCKCEHVIDAQRRIDLLVILGNNEFAVAIENKIWAPDQTNQLRDYNDYLNRHFPGRYLLIYLTPYQSNHTKDSIAPEISQSLTKQGIFKLMGYTDHIIDCVHSWALNCRAERVRNFLFDFEQHLKKQIIGETLMEETQTIAKYVVEAKNYDFIEAAFATAASITQIKERLLLKLSSQVENIAIKNNMKYETDDLYLRNEYCGFSLWKADWQYISITFQFQQKGCNFLIQGLSQEKGKALPLQNKELLLEKLGKPDISNEWWIIYEELEGSMRDWGNNHIPWSKIQSGEIATYIDDTVKQYCKQLDGLNI